MVNTAMIAFLSLLIFTPILGGALVLWTGSQAKFSNAAKPIALASALIPLAICAQLWHQFDPSSFQMQFVEQRAWLPILNIQYYLGVDGIALPLIILTCIMTLIVVIAGWNNIQKRPHQYLAAFLIMEGLMCGVFAALDAILFYIFWEAMLIPMFLIIGIWGGKNRIYATIKFFLYTFLGSVLMLVAFIYLHNIAKAQGIADSFSILNFQQLSLPLDVQKWLFVAFFLAFAVKVPMWPVHTWLPDAHTEAPTGGSVILAAITLKMGAYGFLRFLLPILPGASYSFAAVVVALSLIAVVYIGLVALMQKDMKKLIAYSSIAHMGFVTLGFMITFWLITGGNNDVDTALLGMQGGFIQMISHGFISGAMFLCVGVLYDRMHTRNISDYGGVVNRMPVFASLMMLFAMANAGLPGTSGFVGEFMVLLATFKTNYIWAAIAGMTLILGAAYTLWMYKRVIFGDVTNDQVTALKDVNDREKWFLIALALMILAMGVWPKPVLDLSEASLVHLIDGLQQAKLGL